MAAVYASARQLALVAADSQQVGVDGATVGGTEEQQGVAIRQRFQTPLLRERDRD